MSFEFQTTTEPAYVIMASNIRKNSQPKQLSIGFADKLNGTAVKPLLSLAEIPSLRFWKNTTVDIFPESQKPPKLWPSWRRPRCVQGILTRLLRAERLFLKTYVFSYRWPKAPYSPKQSISTTRKTTWEFCRSYLIPKSWKYPKNSKFS